MAEKRAERLIVWDQPRPNRRWPNCGPPPPLIGAMGMSHYTCRDNASPVQIRVLRACRLSLIARCSTLQPRVRRRFQLGRNRIGQSVSQSVIFLPPDSANLHRCCVIVVSLMGERSAERPWILTGYVFLGNWSDRCHVTARSRKSQIMEALILINRSLVLVVTRELNGQVGTLKPVSDNAIWNSLR